MTTNFSLDLIYIITYCGSVLFSNLYILYIVSYCDSVLPSLLDLIHYNILIMISIVLISYSNRWIKILINGVKRNIFSSFIKSIKSKQNDIKNRQSFILPFILSILDVNVPEGSENLTNYAFGVMTMSLIALLCFMNVLGYFLSLHILDKYNIVNRFPRLNKIKTYYEKTTIIFIIFESLFCISILLFLILSAYLYLKSVIIT